MVVIFLTIILGSMILYNQPTDDIFYHTGDWIFIIIMLAPILMIEYEIYSICVYGFFEEKNKIKTFLKSLSLVMALLFCGLFVLSYYYITTNKIQTVFIVVFLLYVLSKILLLVFKGKTQNSENH